MTKREFIKQYNALHQQSLRINEQIFTLRKSFAKQIALFRVGDVVYRTDFKKMVYYKVLAIDYIAEGNKVVYRVQCIAKGKKVHEVEESLLKRSQMLVVDIKNEPPMPIKKKRCLWNKERIKHYIIQNPSIRYTDIADYFQIHTDTVHRYAKECGIKKNKKVNIDTILAYLKENPNATVNKVAYDLKMSPQTVYRQRSKYQLPINPKGYKKVS